MHRLTRFLVVILAAGVLTALTASLLAPQVGAVLDAHTAEPVAIDLDPLAQRSTVYAADGSVLAGLHGEVNRQEVRLEDIPDVLVETVLAVEDADFYDHGGVNVRSIARALFANVDAGDVRQGGSTITQQLVKNALLEPDQDFSRKIKEAVLAVRLEDQLSKREILERYLNTVFLGNMAYGVQAAAETYFGKQPKDLDQAESALLAGLIKNPIGFDPFRFPEEALARRRDVVARLVRTSLIDQATADAILATPLPTEPRKLLPAPDDYFANDVIRRLLDDERLGETPAERYNAVFKGGLTIKTTVDPRMQKAAADAVLGLLPDTGGRFTAALVSVEPDTGAVRALVGGPGFEQSSYNIATQGIGRQVGSAMKPIVLAAALDAGISPKSKINGAGPCSIPNPGGIPDPYRVENFEGSRGSVSDLYEVTKRSLNCAYVRLGLVVGLPKVVEMAGRLGIDAKLNPDLSLPLGTGEIRPIEIASAYATFAADGVRREPYLIEEVLDREGKVIFRHEDEPERALAPEVARTVVDIMKGTITSGTGTAARFKDRRPAAGKTGTTQDFGDAWFVGYTRQLSTAVWMGSPVGNTDKMRNVGGVARVTGGSYPARIWQAFMGPAHEGLPLEDFPAPPEPAAGERLRLPGEEAPPAPRPRPRPRPQPQPKPKPRPTTSVAPRPTTTAPRPTTTAPAAAPDTDDGGDTAAKPPGQEKKE